ncbi:hypothetical protein ACFVFJ_44465 [Streptomyces sp. NPDC057717]|uniref:hypothetical protein n=1 Tax=Streptomyces sp. NPDC057717 TaxID=3346224 RepID=UPI0036878025
MARIQILELPEGAGDERPPFALVIDQVDYDGPSSHSDWLEGWTTIKDETGASAVLVFEDTIEIPANEVPVDPDGYPLKIRVEGDFEQFRDQVQDEICKAQAQIRGGRLG